MGRRCFPSCTKAYPGLSCMRSQTIICTKVVPVDELISTEYKSRTMTELEPKHYELIMDCLDEFNFEKVHKVMFMLDWRYSDSKDVPTVEYLRKNARKYLIEVVRECLDHREYTIGTGGFRYEGRMYGANNLYIRMAFEIESWDNPE